MGYWLPHEGSNYEAWGLISFDSLAAYETYRARLRADDEGARNFFWAQEKRFVQGVTGTVLFTERGDRKDVPYKMYAVGGDGKLVVSTK